MIQPAIRGKTSWSCRPYSLWISQHIKRTFEQTIIVKCCSWQCRAGVSHTAGSTTSRYVRSLFLEGRYSYGSEGIFQIQNWHKKKVIFSSYCHSCVVNDKGEFFYLEGNRLTCHGGSLEPLKVWECRTAKELTSQILEQWEMAPKVMTVVHGSYIGREAQKAEDALYGAGKKLTRL